MKIYTKNGIVIKKQQDLIIDNPTLVNYIDFVYDAALFQINGEPVNYFDIHFILQMNADNYDKNLKNLQTYFDNTKVFTEVKYYEKTIECICFPEQGYVSWRKNNFYKPAEYSLELYYKNDLKAVWFCN